MEEQNLINASYAGDIATVTTLLKQEMNIDATDKNGATALHWASYGGYSEVVALLLRSGANVHMTDKSGRTAAARAVTRGHHQIAEIIQKHSLSARELAFNTIRSGDTVTIERLLSQGVDVNAQDRDGYMLLGRACWLGQVAIVKTLLEHGAAANALYDNGWTALSLAVAAGHTDVVTVLFRYGTDPYTRNQQGATPLGLAVSQNKRRIACLIQKYRLALEINQADWRIEGLLNAANTGNLSTTKHLLTQGVNPNAPSRREFTPLELAAHRQHTHIVETLLVNGANPNSVGSAGFSALSQATSQKSVWLIDLLLRYGADPNYADEKGFTALGLAIYNGDIDTVKLLLINGANPNYIDVNGETRLGLAWRRGHLHVLQALLENDADPDVKNAKGHTLLSQAAWEGDSDLASLLLKHGSNDAKEALATAVMNNQVDTVATLLRSGVDPNTASMKGYKLLGWAVHEGNYAMVKLLLHHGAAVNAKDETEKGGYTALHLAALAGHAKIAELLIASNANPQLKDSQDMTPLEEAITEGQSEVAQVLHDYQQKKEDKKGDVQAEKDQDNPNQQDRRVKEVTNSSFDDIGLKSVDVLLKELSDLIGLSNIKNDVTQFVNFLRFQQVRKQKGLSVPEQSLHMVFTGNPGTGKTTIARLIAGVYQSLGILSKGHFVETDRSGLVAGYLGQTAINVRKVVESALGGVLFIDEAYSLTHSESGRDEYGYEAVNTLLKLMEDHRDNLIVIVAGYTEPMQKFIRSNPGLQSRFNKFLHFEDYSPTELTEIFKRFAQQADYELSDATETKLNELFTSLHQQRDETFGNARLARNLFEKAINAHANRLVMSASMDNISLVTLQPEDIPNA